jgi:predicted transcriptional regulator
VAALKGALRGAAGVGGMLAFTQAAGETDNAMKNVYNTLGLAATGFAVGGPWGAAVGGAIGLIGTFNDAMNRPTVENLGAYSDALANLEGSFIGVGEAARKAVREQIAQDLVSKGLIQSARTLGVSSSDVVSAVLGQEGATKRLTAAIEENRNKGGALATLQQGRMSDAAVNLASYLGKAIPKYNEFTQRNKDAHQATMIRPGSVGGSGYWISTRGWSVRFVA